MPDGLGALPTFGADVSQATRVREFPGLAGDETAKVFGNLSNQLGQWEDRAASDVGRQQGQVAGTDPNYRPDADESEMGIARRNAATATYSNTLEANARNQLGAVYQQYSQLPADQRQPGKLASSIQSIQDDFDQNHVFPEIKGQFDNAFGSLASSYQKAAQSDLDGRIQDQAKASFLTNQNSARDSAMRLASLPTTSDADLAGQVAQHNAAVDAAKNQGIYSDSQAVELKTGFQQDVLGQRVVTQFQNTPDDQKPRFLANYRSRFLGGPVEGETEQQLAERIQTIAPHLTNQQCVELARQTAGISEGVTDWRKGQNAISQRLPIGTPVATFMSRDGSPSDLYDGGQGVGAPGNNTTHAGVVAGYDDAGNLKLWEQYAGSGGPHLALYKPGDPRGGEKDANNYYSISGKSGQPIGLNNPLMLGSGPKPATNGLSFDTAIGLDNKMNAAIGGIASQAQHAQKQAIGDIGADVKQIEAGYDVPDQEWASKRSQYAASPDPVVAGTFRTADTIRTMYSGFKGMTEPQVQGQVSSMQAVLAKSGATPDQAQLVEAATKYRDRLREQLNSNPLQRAAADGVIPGIVPLDVSSPENLQRTLEARVAAADQTAQHYGLARAPLVTPDDKETIKAVAAAGGEPMVQTAATIARTLGPRAGDFLSQVGGEAPQFAQMGRIAAMGGDPGLLRDAAWAIQQDHQQGAKVQRPAPETVQKTIETTVGNALRAMPEFAQGMKNLAGSALAAQIMREGLDPANLDQGLVAQTVQKSAGATYVGGTQYGGFASHGGGWLGGGQKVLAPVDVRADQFDPLLKTINDADLKALPAPPTAPDGTVMTAAQMRSLQFTPLGPGVYLLSKGDPQGEDPQWATVNGGQRGARARFTLDLNALAPELKARLPGAYK
jgi:hypothetical protein